MWDTFKQWTAATPAELVMVVLSAAATYVAILLYTRLAGLRSFSKMSASDFAMTVAVGSLFGSTISTASPTLLLGIAALGSLYLGQWLLAYVRQRSSTFGKIVDNEPVLLMHGRQIYDDMLRRVNVSRNDVYGKLREANVINYDQVLAVVFETTGDVTVLHSSDHETKIESDLIKNVIGAERIDSSRIASSDN